MLTGLLITEIFLLIVSVSQEESNIMACASLKVTATQQQYQVTI